MQHMSSLGYSTENQRHSQEIVHSELIRLAVSKGIQSGEYMMMISNIPNFRPIYQYNTDENIQKMEPKSSKNKERKWFT
jgi:hypothetical protein